MTSNQTPATCLTDGHCISPDDTTDTCMRCGAVVNPANHPASSGDKTTGLDPKVSAEPVKTLRDEMAMAALTGLLSSPFDILDPDDKPLPYLLPSQWAHAAYILADAMMKARRTPTEGE